MECTVFEFNNYDPFVANKTMNGKIGSNHTCGWCEFKPFWPKSQWKFLIFVDWKRGDPYIEEVKATRGNIRNFLGITLDYSEKGKINIDMRDYVKQMINYLPIKLDENNRATTPTNENLF